MGESHGYCEFVLAEVWITVWIDVTLLNIAGFASGCAEIDPHSILCSQRSQRERVISGD